MADGGRFYGGSGRPFGDSAWPVDPYYTPSHIPDPAVSQKLDRVLALLETQGRDIESMRADAATMKGEIENLKQKSTESSSSSSTPHRTVKKLPTELSAAVRQLQEKANPDMKFDGSLSYNSDHNQEVKAYLLGHLNDQFSAQFTPKKIKKAVHRYYESRRRLFNDSKPERKESAAKTKSEQRKKDRRKRLYNARKKHLKSAAEERLWGDINWEFMSEESQSEEDDEIIRKHPVTFRSETLNKLVSKLDKRASKKETSKHGYKKKQRVLKSPSKLSPPSSAPSWAVVDADTSDRHTPSASRTPTSDLRTASISEHTSTSDQRTASASDRRIPSTSDRRTASASDRRIPSTSDQRTASASDRRIPSTSDQRAAPTVDRHTPSSSDQRSGTKSYRHTPSSSSHSKAHPKRRLELIAALDSSSTSATDSEDESETSSST